MREQSVEKAPPLWKIILVLLIVGVILIEWGSRLTNNDANTQTEQVMLVP